MMLTSIVLVSIASTLIVLTEGQNPWVLAGDQCETANSTRTEALPLHKYKVMETCIYNSLRDEYAKNHEGEQLMESPPLARESDKMEVQFKSTSISDIRVTDTTKSLTVNGFFIMQWEDFRLRWNEDKWKLTTIKIESMGSIWVPDLASDDLQPVGLGTYVFFSDINTTSSGVVTAKADFTLNSERNCIWTMEDFPNDKVSCCEKFVSRLYGDRIKFTLASKTVDLHKSWKLPSWAFLSSYAELQQRNGGSSQSIQICTALERDAKNLRVELTVPMAIAAIVGLVAPLHPSLKAQLYVKLFALLLQFLTFQFLVENNQQINMSEKTPRLYKFYEFTLAVTLINILVSFGTMALCRCKSRIPPPHSLTLLAKAIGSCLCCSGGDKAESSATEADTNNDWEAVWLALNSLTSILLALIYILGIIIIAA